MVYIQFDILEFQYHIQDTIRLFFEDQEMVYVKERPLLLDQGIFVSLTYIEGDFKKGYGVLFCAGGETFEKHIEVPAQTVKEDLKHLKPIKWQLKRAVYDFLSKHTGHIMPWGILTGIRPSKIVHELMAQGMESTAIYEKLIHQYRLSEGKAALLYGVAETEKKVLDHTRADSVGVYIGIPFCPSRCLYCSFTSNPIAKYRHWVPIYLEALIKELHQTMMILEEKSLKVQSLYIGGGTPTALDAQALSILMKAVLQAFDVAHLEEYTVEAGRPDSIDGEKLDILKAGGVSRISINPQTMNDVTLKAIGRQHSANDIIQCYQLAKEKGFDHINMDLILGLSGENEAMFLHTLDEIALLKPESITVHTLAVKRASKLKEALEKKTSFQSITPKEATVMIEKAQAYAHKMGMHAYYLYRQKNMVGNLENIGYCKPGFESIYNIQIMEEKQSIIALGAGAVTKVIYSAENRVERAFNVKSVEEYINRVDEMVDRKRKLLDV